MEYNSIFGFLKCFSLKWVVIVKFFEIFLKFFEKVNFKIVVKYF